MQQNSLNLPLSPVIASRVPVFSATTTSAFNWERETSWGKVRVSGKLNQSHRDVLDAVMACASKSKISDDTGDLMLLVDMYHVKKILGRNSTNIDFILEKLKDMSSCIIEIFDEKSRVDQSYKGANHIAGMVVDIKESSKKVPANSRTGNAAFGHEDRALWVVRLSSAWVRLMNEGLVYQYAEYLPTIRAMKRDVSKAAARFMLTHNVGAKFSIDAVFHAINSGVSSGVLRQWKLRVYDDTELLLKCGIKLDNGYFERIHDKKCYIYNID